ncbi:hypothetical protein [Halorussus pelagicus]|uniref:hypothetical protein n=1 Tax=Halorussus pelagicus TaxID=2505977 RepID=UPI000FFB128D|nr:hypothetical protein [Halorussus pelagicus]
MADPSDRAGESDDAADLVARIDSLETKLDQLLLLIVVLIILQLVSTDGDLLAHLFFVALGLTVVGFVSVFLFALGKRL